MFQFRTDAANRKRKGADEGFDPEEKPFLDHLEDLRVMFFQMLVTLAVGITLCFVFTKPLVDAIRLPMVWANVGEEDTIKAVFHFGHREARSRFSPGDLVVTQGGFLADVVKEDVEKGITWAQIAPGVDIRIKTDTVVGKIPSAEAKIAPNDLRRLSFQNPLIMETFKPYEGLVIVLKLAFYSAIVITFPLLTWFLMGFIWPGLRQAEKRAMIPALLIGVGLFIIGAAFAFRIGLPFALRWLCQWNFQHGMNPGWRVGYYIEFVTQVTLVFGVMFELPVVVMALVHLEVLSYRAMKESRSYAIVILLVVAAFLTPPDPITLLLLGGPLILLYELCIWMAYLIERKRRKQEEAEEKRRIQERTELEARHAQLVAEGRIPADGDAGASGNGSTDQSATSEEAPEESYGRGDYNYEGDSYDYGYDQSGESSSYDSRDARSASSGVPELIDINNASLEELQKLPGIGPKLAQQIVEARPFYSEEELEYHAFLPPSVINLIRDRVTFH